jgi:uncharacterized protein (TIGR03000 family)
MGCYGGGCYGGGCYGGGCYGGGCYGGGCYGGGCYGGVGVGCYGGAGMGCHGGVIIDAGPVKMPETGKDKDKDKMPEGKGEARLSAPATIVVSLPADAKLTIDGTATKSTSSTRVFVSPELIPGQDFFYTLTAEIVRDGKPVTQTERITVRAGQTTQVSLDPKSATAVASK